MDLLIVVDMQNDFINGALGTKQARKMTYYAIEQIYRYKGEIIYTMDTHDEHYLESNEGKHLPIVHCLKNTEGWELIPMLKAYQEEKHSLVIEKSTFGSPALVETLKTHYPDVSSILIIGLCTDLCVMVNALLLKSFFPDVKITVDALRTAGTTPKSHLQALALMKKCQIDIINEDIKK
ncbi:MAG: cysteine hydrolase family protein [Bacilli bacterium]